LPFKVTVYSGKQLNFIVFGQQNILFGIDFFFNNLLNLFNNYFSIFRIIETFIKCFVNFKDYEAVMLVKNTDLCDYKKINTEKLYFLLAS